MIRAILLALLLPVGAWAQACPTATDLAPGIEWVELPAGCALPVPGVWYRPATHTKAVKRLAGLAELVKQERAAKETARTERDTSRAECREQIDALRKTLELVQGSLQSCTEPPSRAVWAGLGAGAGVVVCAGSILLGASL